MIKVVGVHGIAQQQRGRNQLLHAWGLALKDGLELANDRRPVEHELDIVFYGDEFLKDDGDGTKKGVAPGLPALSDDEIAFLESVERELVPEDEPIEATKALGLAGPVARLAAWLDAKFGAGARALAFGDLIQVRRFQHDPELHGIVLERVRATLAERRPSVLIGHSLGSVVALEALCNLPDHGVRTLVTLGSPLALRTIQDALGPRAFVLTALPPQVERWSNLYDPRDPVACAGGLESRWKGVVDGKVSNESDPHAVERYLGKKATGAAVLAR